MNSYELQQLLSAPDLSATVRLPSGEYEGPFLVDRPCHIIGNNTTLWRNKGTILSVACGGVTLENLRIEITNDNLPANECVAIHSKTGDTVCKNVEIIGRFVGIDGEEDAWGIPKLVSLGKFPAERECSYKMELFLPIEAELISIFHDITVTPEKLVKGMNEVTITTQAIRNGSYLYGELLLRSAVTRRIYLSGSADEKVEDYADGGLVYKADTAELERQEADCREEIIYPEIQIPPPEKNEMYKPEISDVPDEIPQNVILSRGMHVPVTCSRVEVELVYDNKDFPMDVDAFAFMANQKGDVISNDRFIFFGNDHSLCGTVKYLNAPDKKVMYLNFDNAPFDVKQIDIAYSIYENPLNLNFSNLKNPAIEMRFSTGQTMRYILEKPLSENTIVGLGAAFTGTRWEIIPYGMIYPRGLSNLCENYGLQVN